MRGENMTNEKHEELARIVKGLIEAQAMAAQVLDEIIKRIEKLESAKRD